MFQSTQRLKVQEGILHNDSFAISLCDIRAFEVRETFIREAFFLWPTILAGLVFVCGVTFSFILEIPGLQPDDAPSLSGRIWGSLLFAFGIFVAQGIASVATCFFIFPRRLWLFTDYGRIDLPVKDWHVAEVRDQLLAAVSNNEQLQNKAEMATPRKPSDQI